MVHNDKGFHMDGGTGNTDNVHSDDGVVHKDYSVPADGDSNHDKDMDLSTFNHLLFFSPFTL